MPVLSTQLLLVWSVEFLLCWEEKCREVWFVVQLSNTQWELRDHCMCTGYQGNSHNNSNNCYNNKLIIIIIIRQFIVWWIHSSFDWASVWWLMPECPLLVCLPTWMSTTYQQSVLVWCVWLWLRCISAQLLPPVQLSMYGTSVYSTCWSVVLYCGVQVSIDAAVSLETSSFTANLQSCFYQFGFSSSLPALMHMHNN